MRVVIPHVAFFCDCERLMLNYCLLVLVSISLTGDAPDSACGSVSCGVIQLIVSDLSVVFL